MKNNKTDGQSLETRKTMTYKLFLDDVREAPYEDWVTVKTYGEFCAYIEEHGVPLSISFDHDLGEYKTGYDCVKWLVKQDMDKMFSISELEWSVHSANLVGAKNIRKYLKNYLDNKDEH